VDADGCPVKEEIYRVARRHDLPVWVVANSWMRVPDDRQVELKVVSGAFDAADDWIVEAVTDKDLVVTADIPLAARCLEKGARVLGHRGRPFTEDSIGEALASRELMSQLRDMGVVSGGPPPFAKQDRSSFLHSLDEAIRGHLDERG
jgi:uncharacterized protein